MTYMKSSTINTHVKVTQWNQECVKTVYIKDDIGQWILMRDRIPIDCTETVDKTRMIIYVHKDFYIEPVQGTGVEKRATKDKFRVKRIFQSERHSKKSKSSESRPSSSYLLRRTQDHEQEEMQGMGE